MAKRKRISVVYEEVPIYEPDLFMLRKNQTERTFEKFLRYFEILRGMKGTTIDITKRTAFEKCWEILESGILPEFMVMTYWTEIKFIGEVNFYNRQVKKKFKHKSAWRDAQEDLNNKFIKQTGGLAPDSTKAEDLDFLNLMTEWVHTISEKELILNAVARKQAKVVNKVFTYLDDNS